MRPQFHLRIAALTPVGGPCSEPLRQNPLEKEGAPPAARCSAPRPPPAIPPRPAPLQPRMGRTARSKLQARGGGSAQHAPSAPRRAAFKRPLRTAPDWRRRAGHTPGQGRSGRRGRRYEGERETREGENQLRRDGSCGAPQGGSTGNVGRIPRRAAPLPPNPPPSFPHRHRLAASCPDPPRSGPDVLPHLPLPPAPPPRRPHHSPTSWPRPCRRISPPARPGGLAAAAALGPPWPLPWWLPGRALSPSDGEERGGGPRLGTRGRCEDTSARGERSAAAASRPLAGRPLGSPRLTRRVAVGASRSRAAAARSLLPLGAACGSRLSARLGASRCCRRLRLRARKATRGRSRGDCRGGEGGAAPSRSISR